MVVLEFIRPACNSVRRRFSIDRREMAKLPPLAEGYELVVAVDLGTYGTGMYTTLLCVNQQATRIHFNHAQVRRSSSLSYRCMMIQHEYWIA